MKEKRAILSLPVLCGLLICLLPGDAAANAYNLAPTDDVCVRSDYDDTLGNPVGNLLYVGGRFLAPDYNDFWATFMKFDLSNLAIGTINSATLYLYVYDWSAPGGGSGIIASAYEVLSDPSDWDEYHMTWDYAFNHLTISGLAAGEVSIGGTGSCSLNLTAAARNHLGEDFSICLKTKNQPEDGEKAQFCSKDFGVTGYLPYLHLDYTPPEPPSSEHSFLEWLTGVDISVYCLPGGDGQALQSCFAAGGYQVDATVGVYLMSVTAAPVPGWPAEDICIVTADPGLLLPAGLTIADQPTDQNGYTTISGALYAGGQGTGLRVAVTDVGELNDVVPYHVNSPDIDADGLVNLTDVVYFAQDYSTGYDYRSDFLYDGVLNLSDLVLMSQGMGSALP